MMYNRLRGDEIKPGMTIYIPAGFSLHSSENEDVDEDQVYEHLVYPGETLENVASQYGCTAEEILSLSEISDPESVRPGIKLYVPIPR